MDKDQIFHKQVDELMYRLASVKQKSHQIPTDKLDTLQHGLDWAIAMVKVIQHDEGIQMFDGTVKMEYSRTHKARPTIPQIVNFICRIVVFFAIFLTMLESVMRHHWFQWIGLLALTLLWAYSIVEWARATDKYNHERYLFDQRKP